jgi:Zn-dependent protease/CBS domain-containing protein
MKYTLYLGKISGIKILMHWTFLILILWIVFSNAKSGADINQIARSVGFILAVFTCVILHELGHALAAKRYNIKTLGITILPIGGLAQLESMPEKPKEELVVALAGPVVNVVISIILFPFVLLTAGMADLNTLQTITAQNFLPSLMSINVWLALFNLIPAFPMDGGRILRALLGYKFNHARATEIAASIGQVLAIAIIFFGFFYNAFLIFIGFFIFLSAKSEAAYSRSKFHLKGFTVNDVLMHQVPFINDSASIKEAADKLLDSQSRDFLVVRDGEPVGTLSREQIIQALAKQGETASVDSIKDNELLSLDPRMELEKAWSLIQQKGKSLMPVFSDGKLVGVVKQENIAEFILIHAAAEKVSHT